MPTPITSTTAHAGGSFGGVLWQIRSTQLWIRQPGNDWQMPPGSHSVSFSTPRRVTFTRSGTTTIRLFVDGAYIYSIESPISSGATNMRVTGTDQAGFTSMPSDARLWGMSLWNTVRSDAVILSNPLTSVNHHWLLKTDLADSVNTNGITLSQVGTAVFATI